AEQVVHSDGARGKATMDQGCSRVCPMSSQAILMWPRSRRRRALWALVALAFFVAACWPAASLMERRETLRRRLEIELLGGPEPRVKVEEAGWSWLHPLVDQRCFEKVVEINLSYAERYDYAKLS